MLPRDRALESTSIAHSEGFRKAILTNRRDPMNTPSTIQPAASTASPTECSTFVLCHACDYDLTGGVLDDGRLTCPECGYRQAPTPTAKWSSSGTRLLRMTLPMALALLIGAGGYVLAAPPVIFLGAALLLMSAIGGPLWVTWRTLRLGYASERRVATADRLMVIGLVLNAAVVGGLTIAVWAALRSI